MTTRWLLEQTNGTKIGGRTIVVRDRRNHLLKHYVPYWPVIINGEGHRHGKPTLKREGRRSSFFIKGRGATTRTGALNEAVYLHSILSSHGQTRVPNSASCKGEWSIEMVVTLQWSLPYLIVVSWQPQINKTVIMGSFLQTKVIFWRKDRMRTDKTKRKLRQLVRHRKII